VDDPRLLLLDPADNVLVARAPLRAGETVVVGRARLTLQVSIALGHKIARRPIRPGEAVLKYGAPIGLATADIAPGDHVHTQNVRSAYTPSYSLDEARRSAGAER